MNVSCAILAGGKSKRFGGNKFLVDFKGKPLIAHVFERVKSLFDRVYLVVKDRTPFEGILKDVVILEDERKDVFTPLAGIETALMHIESPYVFVVSGDMPFIREEDIKRLLSYIPQGWEAIVPKTDKGLEPLFSVYSRGCLSYVKRALDRGEKRVNSFFENIRVLYLESGWNEKTFLNVNTQEDLERLKEMG